MGAKTSLARKKRTESDITRDFNLISYPVLFTLFVYKIKINTYPIFFGNLFHELNSFVLSITM